MSAVCGEAKVRLRATVGRYYVNRLNTIVNQLRGRVTVSVNRFYILWDNLIEVYFILHLPVHMITILWIC